MRLRKLSAVLVVALLSLFSTSLASAQTAYLTPFTTAITFQNVGTGPAQVTLTYYSESTGTPAASIPLTAPLAKGASTSVNVGSVTQVGPSFKGSGVLSSDQPIVATLVQLPGPGLKNRPLSNGFSEGASTIRLATVLKGTTNTVFSVQNAGAGAANVTVNLIPVSGATISIPVNGLPAGATKYFDMGKLTQITAATFNGSATITSPTAGASLVATAMELSTTGRASSAFESVTTGANKVYMPSAFCNAANAAGLINSFYAIQNVGNGPTNITVTFSNNKTVVRNNIAAGAKTSVAGCDAPNNTNFAGAATITASAGGSIVAIGKIAGGAISAAFLGATAGAPKLALPYVRFANNTNYNAGLKQRTFIAIQNIGAPLAANTVKVHFIDKFGVTLGTFTIPTALATGGKASVNPSQIGAAGAEFGSYPDKTFGGGAVVEGPAGSQLVAIARVTTFDPTFHEDTGEDYNGQPIQ